jgi:hypothetical protein
MTGKHKTDNSHSISLCRIDRFQLQDVDVLQAQVMWHIISLDYIVVVLMWQEKATVLHDGTVNLLSSAMCIGSRQG